MARGGDQQQRRGRSGTATTWPPPATAGVALPSPTSSTSGFETLWTWVWAEAGPGRLLPWVPIAFWTGIALYFAAEHEPVAWVAAATAGLLCVAAFLLRRQRWFPLILLIAAIATSFAMAAMKTARVAHEVLAKPLYSVAITGFVETHEERERTDRFVLRVATMDSPRAAPKLTRVRLSLKKGMAPAVGSFVELKARLQPPLSPLRPGSYDFGRDLYFQGIGASGFVMGSPKSSGQSVDSLSTVPAGSCWLVTNVAPVGAVILTELTNRPLCSV